MHTSANASSSSSSSGRGKRLYFVSVLSGSIDLSLVACLAQRASGTLALALTCTDCRGWTWWEDLLPNDDGPNDQDEPESLGSNSQVLCHLSTPQMDCTTHLRSVLRNARLRLDRGWVRRPRVRLESIIKKARSSIQALQTLSLAKDVARAAHLLASGSHNACPQA